MSSTAASSIARDDAADLSLWVRPAGAAAGEDSVSLESVFVIDTNYMSVYKLSSIHNAKDRKDEF